MSRYKCTLEKFLDDVKHHETIILNDSDGMRHIRFKNPKTRNMYFDLTTWGDHLCISGDMGTYVFQRVEDMFTFFRRNDMIEHLNHYWDEKLESICRGGGRKEWDEDLFIESIHDWVEYFYEDDSRVDLKKLKDFIDSELKYKDISCNQLCWGVLDDLECDIKMYQDCCEDFNFDDFWYDASCEQPSYHYTWCQMAICWGVQQYDKFKNGGDK